MGINDLISPELKVLNVTVPKVESAVTLNTYLRKNGLNYYKQLCFKNIKSYLHTYNCKSILFPEVYVFNKSGYKLELNQGSIAAQKDAFDFIVEINNSKINKTNNLYDYSEHFIGLNLSSLEDYDFVSIITWAIYAGDINKIFAFKAIEFIEKLRERGFKIDIYLHNLDLQVDWDYSIFN